MILQALDRYYERMAARGEAPAFGYVLQSVRGEVVLSPVGQVVAIVALGDEKRGRRLTVPAPITEPSSRTANAIVPYFLADNPSYLLGLRPGDNRTQAKFEASFRLHLAILKDATDPALRAVLRFFARYLAPSERIWDLPDFVLPYVFRLDGEFEWAHQKPEAVARWGAYLDGIDRAEALCLVTGETQPITRLHPKNRGL